MYLLSHGVYLQDIQNPLIFLYFLGLGLEDARRCGTRVL